MLATELPSSSSSLSALQCLLKPSFLCVSTNLGLTGTVSALPTGLFEITTNGSIFHLEIWVPSWLVGVLVFAVGASLTEGVGVKR